MFPEVIRNHFWVFGFEIYESCIDVEMFLREHRALYCVSKTGFAILVLLKQSWFCERNPDIALAKLVLLTQS